MKLLIIRHADPDYSIDSLTPTGWKEAELLADRMEKLNIKAFYVSPLGRARDTASLTLNRLNREAQVLDWLREFPAKVQKPDQAEPGIAWDWLPQDWVQDEVFYHKDQWMDHPVFQNSDIKEVRSRVIAGLDALLCDHGYARRGNGYQALCPNEDTVALFCHFGLECVLLSHLLNISPMPLWHGTCAAPTSVTTLITEERREGIATFRMSSFGDISHLYHVGQEPSFSARFCETYRNFDQRHD